MKRIYAKVFFALIYKTEKKTLIFGKRPVIINDRTGFHVSVVDNDEIVKEKEKKIAIQVISQV